MKNRQFGYTGWCMMLVAVATLESCGSGGRPTEEERTGAREPSTAAVDPQKLLLLADTVLTERGLNVRLFAEAPLVSKYENLYIHVQSTEGALLDGVSVDFHTHMDMGMMSHGGPYRSPEPTGDGWFRGGAVFIMPDIDDMGRGWLLKTRVSSRGKVDSLTFKLPVAQAGVTRSIPFDGWHEGRFFLSLLLPDTVPVGRMPVDLILHHVEPTEFPAAGGYTVKLEPHMPDMGHGSKDNQDATPLERGHYRGSVNLPMVGLWEIHGTLLKDGKQVSTEPIVFKVHVVHR